MSKALGQDGSFHGLLESSLINTLAAAGFNQVGNAGKKFELDSGDAEMIAMHALMGGLVAKAQGGEFATGALAAGVNEAVVADMDALFEGLEEPTRKNLLLGASQLVGLLAAVALNGDEQSLETGAWVAKNSTQYNFMGHKDLDAWEEEAGACEADGSCKEVKQKFRELSVANDDALDAACSSDPAGCVQLYGYLLDDRDGLQERIAGLMLDDNIPLSLKTDLHAYLMQNQSAVSTLTQVSAQASLELNGFSPEAAALIASALGAAAGGVPGKKVSSGTTREGVVRTNEADWRELRDNWDDLGYGQALSAKNRAAIANRLVPKVDDDWVKYFPEDAGLKGEKITMHHIQGLPLTVPLPATRHLDAHMPGGFRYNPGGPGSSLPAYPEKRGNE